MIGIKRRLASGDTPRLGALVSSATNLRRLTYWRQITAVSLSLISFNLLAATRAQAADSAPLPIKRISVDAADELVIQFGTHVGSFPSPPHVLDLPGPNHRIVMDFSDTCVDKVNMPSVDDLSTRLHKLLPAIKSIHYSNLANAGKPTARVVIEVPEQLAVKPRVVKLEEDSVTITLGDHMRDVDIPETKPEEPLGRSSLKEPKKTSNDTAKAKTDEMASDSTVGGLEVANATNPAAATATASAAVVPAVANTNAGANPSGTTNANWDWTSAGQSNASLGGGAPVAPVLDSTSGAATAAAAAATPVPALDGSANSAAVTPVPAADISSTPATAATPVPDAVRSSTPTAVVAQAPDDATAGSDNQPRTHGSAPITETFEKVDTPMTDVQPGASTTVTPGAAAVMKRPEVDTPKPATVAETDARQFQDALRPSPEAAKEPADSGADAPLQLKPAMRATPQQQPRTPQQQPRTPQQQPRTPRRQAKSQRRQPRPKPQQHPHRPVKRRQQQDRKSRQLANPILPNRFPLCSQKLRLFLPARRRQLHFTTVPTKPS
jgi:hypothetical protein